MLFVWQQFFCSRMSKFIRLKSWKNGWEEHEESFSLMVWHLWVNKLKWSPCSVLWCTFVTPVWTCLSKWKNLFSCHLVHSTNEMNELGWNIDYSILIYFNFNKLLSIHTKIHNLLVNVGFSCRVYRNILRLYIFFPLKKLTCIWNIYKWIDSKSNQNWT